jgi:hypothetical protein
MSYDPNQPADGQPQPPSSYAPPPQYGQQPTYYSQAPMYGPQPQFYPQPTPKKSRRWLWITLAIILVVLIGGATAIVLTVNNSPAKTVVQPGIITEFPIPTANSSPGGITAGPDGNLWFTECVSSSSGCANGQIGRITPTGQFTEFPLPNPNSTPQGITAGPDGNLWFTEGGANNIGRITSGK